MSRVRLLAMTSVGRLLQWLALAGFIALAAVTQSVAWAAVAVLWAVACLLRLRQGA